MRGTNSKFASGTREFFVAFGAFDIALALVFPEMVAICSKVNSGCNIPYCDNNCYNGCDYAD
jgi:hypothetical protein